MNVSRVALCLCISLLCLTTSACFVTHPITSLPRDVAILSDNARAKRAMARGDLKAAEGFLTAQKYTHRSREVAGSSWGGLSYQAAQIVLGAQARGEPVDPDGLFQSYMVMSYSIDLATSLDYLAKAQQLIDAGRVGEPDASRTQVYDQRLPRLLLYRYLESGGRIDWSTEIEQGFYELYLRSPKPAAGEHDPRDFYRFLDYLTVEDREWFFANHRLRVPLDEAIWRNDAALRDFSRTQEYFEWYSDNYLDWHLSNALTLASGAQMICAARKRGYDVIPRPQWNIHRDVDPQTCQTLPGS